LIILKQVIDNLVQIIYNIVQSDSDELVEMGLGCTRALVEKFGEKLVGKSIEILENYLDKVTEAS